MSYEIKPVRVNYQDTSDGLLVYRNGVLVAVLTRLGPTHNGHAGWWDLSCGFEVAGMTHQCFPNLDAAYTHFDEMLSPN